MAIKIPFVSDVTDFLRGTKNLHEELDDVADALDDITKAGDKVDDSVGADLESVGRDADAAAEKVEKSFKDTFKEVEAAGKTTTRRLKSDLDHVGGPDPLGDFRDEAKQNLAESVSSFQGDAESAVDAVQSTFGGLATALGPAGVIGSAVVAAGIGVLRGMATKAEEAVKEVSERAVEMAGSLREGIPAAQQLNAALEELADTATTTGRWFWTEASTGLRDLVRQAEDAEVGISEFLNAAAGTDARATQQQLEGINDRIKAINDEIKRGDPQQQSRLLNQYGDELGKLRTASKTLTTQLETQRAAQAAYNAELQYGPVRAEELTGTTAALADAMADNAEATADANDALADNARLTGAAVESEWDMKDALAAVGEARKDNGKSLDTNTTKGRENARAIKAAVDSINDFGDAQVESGKSVKDTNAKLDAQERALVAKVAHAFGITTTQAQAYINKLGGIPKRKETEVKVTDNGTAAATSRKVDEAAKDRDSRITVSADMTGVDRQIKTYFNGKVYNFRVAPRPGHSVAI